MRRARRPSPAWLRWAVPVCAVVLLAPRPMTAGPCDGPVFGTSAFPPALSVGTAWGTVVGDFYGPGGVPDGKPDVVVARDPSQVRLFAGDGTGNLTFLNDIAAGNAPRELVAADFNRNGFLDVALIPTGLANTVRFLQGDGADFSASFDLTVTNPTRLATGDFDRDGVLDLVVLNETGGAITVFRGDGAFGFLPFASQPTIPGAPGPRPTAAAAADFDANGTLDLAVTVDDAGTGSVLIYLGDGLGSLGGGVPTTDPFSIAAAGGGPADIVAGDVTGDGSIDLVTADHDAASATVLSGDRTGLFAPVQVVTNGLTEPLRVELADFDRDGLVDLAVLNETGAPQPTVVVLPGSTILPIFDESALTSVDLVQPQDLVLGDLDVDGRVDLVVSDFNVGASEGEALWIPNLASPDCARTSFFDAPRAYPGGNGATWTDVADFDGDGIPDLVAANAFSSSVQLLQGTGNGYAPGSSLLVAGSARGVATADFDVDGHPDAVVAAGDNVQLLMNDGFGALAAGPATLLGGGAFASAVVAADFNGDGAPDVAATGQFSNSVYIVLGDGLGGLGAPAPIAVGTNPRALAVGRLDVGPTMDIVVANATTDDVTVLLGNGDGTFTPGPVQTMGNGPWGVALVDFDGDGERDLVTADHDGSTVTVRIGLGNGDFDPPQPAIPVTGMPIAIGAFDITADLDADIAVVTGDQTLVLFPGNGDGTFGPGTSFPVRTRPSSVTPVDADSDGLLDLAIPCKDADSVVVLLARPPSLARAPVLSTGLNPLDVVKGDLDRDGDLDLAVVNSGDGTILVFENDGGGGFTPRGTFGTGGANPQALVVADLNGDGVLDLATTIPGAPGDVSVLLGNAAPPLTFGGAVLYTAGSNPDDLVVGDFDRDGALDLASVNRTTPGQVAFLRNVGGGAFALQNSVPVGDAPTAITSGDFNRDGFLDVAVANDDSNTLTVLYNDGTWAFAVSETLPLDPADTSPVSIASGDFDGDGDTDLAAVTFISDTVSVFENVGFAPFFNVAPLRLDGSHKPQFVTAADVNLDGTLDIIAAADGMKVLPGGAGLLFEPSEDVIAGLDPRALTIGDFNRDGHPDAAVVNETSNDLSILLSSACQSRRLVMGMSPLACQVSGPPFPVAATVWVEDDGGNLAVCETGSVMGGIVPGTGAGGASFLGLNPIPVTLGVADFSAHSIDMAGSRYELQFDLSGLPPAFSRSFSLGGAVTIAGPPSICPLDSEMYLADPGFDAYTWSLDAVPFDWQQVTTLSQPPLATNTGYTLSVDARVDGCTVMASTSVYVGDLASVTITPTGAVTVCVDCLGGAVISSGTGGGAATEHKWGYRTTSLTPPIIDIPGQTGDTYVINGLDFPGVGDYFLVERTTPTCGTQVTSNEVMVSVTAMVPSGEVQSLAATSRGPGGVGENVLQWISTIGSAEENLIRWNESTGGTSDCVAPADTSAPFDGQHVVSTPPPDSKQSWVHNGVTLDTAYCYSVFVKVLGSYSPGRTVKARAFDSSSGPAAWAYFSGATAVVPPTVSEDGIMALSNDQSVHALSRGILGGTWPATYTPSRLSGVAHSRSPAVPFIAPVAGADTLFFVGDDSGVMNAFNTATGLPGMGWGPTPLPTAMVTGAPGGFFAQYGGPADAILVGTRNTSAGPSLFYSLDVATGAEKPPAFNGTATTMGLGPVMSTPTLDYGTGRVYVTSWRYLGTEPSVWCLQVKPDGTLEPMPVWTQTLGDISASPVLANGRLYVANTVGQVYSLDATDGMPGPVYPTADGAAKGFLFPNRATGELFFATDTKVHSISDDGAGLLTLNWSWDAGATLEPNIVLHWPTTDLLYVGSKDGTLWEVDFSAAPVLVPKSVVLGDGVGVGHLGAPSLDIGLMPPDVSAPGNSLLLVGSESGALYAVEVPLP